MVTHPSTNQAQSRVTSLIRPTTLPLRHAATSNVDGRVCVCVCLTATVAVVKSRDMHWALLAQKDHKDVNLASLRMLLIADGANPCT